MKNSSNPWKLPRRFMGTVATLACLALLSGRLAAQSTNTNTISSWVFPSGGGTLTGGVFVVDVTIGQAVVGQVSGGPYIGSVGFWAFAFQSPGVPFLSISATTNNAAILSWPTNATAFVLQQNNDLTTTNWVAVTNVPAIIGGSNQLVLPAIVGHEYFRLKQ